MKARRLVFHTDDFVRHMRSLASFPDVGALGADYLRQVSPVHLVEFPGPWPPASRRRLRAYYAPALNTKGQIAFLGTTQSGLVGIFTGADPEEDRVIAVGDDLDGSTVSDLSALSFRTALNNKGQIAFIAALKNGRTGVYRADPKRRHRQGDPDGDRRH